MSEPAQGVRLAKRVAAQQGCSRSQAEALIAAGAVQVAGQTVTDPARRVPEAQAVQVAANAFAAPAVGTLLLYKPAGVSAVSALHAAWAAAGETTPLPRGLQECWPLPEAASGLSVCSGDPGVLRRLADRERPLEVEWLLALPMAASAQALPVLHGMGLRCSLSHEREGQGQWRVVGKGMAVAQLPLALQGQAFAQAQWRRQRLGRMGLAPLLPGQVRILRATEKF
jgi:23S rRNA pseudouridine2604 synthase